MKKQPKKYRNRRISISVKNSDGTVVIQDWTPEPLEKLTNYTFTAEHGVEAGTTYQVNMRAIDLAGEW